MNFFDKVLIYLDPVNHGESWFGRKFRIGVDASFWMDNKYRMKFLKPCEKAGFDSVWFGDHFLPWHHSFKHSFYVWPVMAAAAERTKKIAIGVDVTVPIGGRYHPAIVAQAIGTLDSMYPGRFYLGVGSGEAMSEKRFMGRWPPWKERIERLAEAVELIRKLFTSDDFFDFNGKYFSMEKVYLYVKPKKKSSNILLGGWAQCSSICRKVWRSPYHVRHS